MGGGPATSWRYGQSSGPILETIAWQRKSKWHATDWRPGDQRVFYADFRKARHELDWEPKIDLEEGIEMLFDWVKENKNLFQ